MCHKWIFWDEPECFNKTPAFPSISAWRLLKGYTCLEVKFLTQIERELSEILKSDLKYSNVPREYSEKIVL